MVSDSDLSPLYLRSWLWLFPEGLPVVYKALALVRQCQSLFVKHKIQLFELIHFAGVGTVALMLGHT